jgi:hypothetical protein
MKQRFVRSGQLFIGREACFFFDFRLSLVVVTCLGLSGGPFISLLLRTTSLAFEVASFSYSNTEPLPKKKIHIGRFLDSTAKWFRVRHCQIRKLLLQSSNKGALFFMWQMQIGSCRFCSVHINPPLWIIRGSYRSAQYWLA